MAPLPTAWRGGRGCGSHLGHLCSLRLPGPGSSVLGADEKLKGKPVSPSDRPFLLASLRLVQLCAGGVHGAQHRTSLRGTRCPPPASSLLGQEEGSCPTISLLGRLPDRHENAVSSPCQMPDAGSAGHHSASFSESCCQPQLPAPQLGRAPGQPDCPSAEV